MITSAPAQALSKQARLRISWIQHYGKYRNARLTCRHFGISPSTFYHWKRKYDLTHSPSDLEDTASRRPHTFRKATWGHQTLLLINKFLEENPESSNKTIQEFLKKHNVQVSASTTSRIMRGLLAHKAKFSW